MRYVEDLSNVKPEEIEHVVLYKDSPVIAIIHCPDAKNEPYMVVWKDGSCGSYKQDGSTYCGTEKFFVYKPKRVKVERWVNVYSNGSIYIYPNKERADRYASNNRIACKHLVFEVEEGEGLE